MGRRSQASKRWRSHVRDHRGRAPRGMRPDQNGCGDVHAEPSFAEFEAARRNHCPTPRKRAFNTEAAALEAIRYNTGLGRKELNLQSAYRCPRETCGKWHLTHHAKPTYRKAPRAQETAPHSESDRSDARGGGQAPASD